MSAATLVEQPPGEYATGVTYAELAAFAREKGVEPCEADLFRRMLFNCFIHNTDDHLRNHAFVGWRGAWRLSPVYDLVPCAKKRLVLPPAPGILPLPDPAAAVAAHAMFRLSREEAAQIYDEVADGMGHLPGLLDQHAVSPRDRETVAALMPFAFNPPAISGVASEQVNLDDHSDEAAGCKPV